MFDPKTLDQLSQALVARMLPYLNGSGSGGNDGNGPKHLLTVKEAAALLPKRLLTIKEAAAYIGRSVSALYKLKARGEIPYVVHGRNLRFDVKELDKWIERDKV